MNGLGKDIGSLIIAKHALAEVNAVAAGSGDATEVDGTTITLLTDLATRALSVCFLIWARATLTTAKSLTITSTLQYYDGSWHDITGKADELLLTLTSAGGSTELGVAKHKLDLTKIPAAATAIRCQVTPNLTHSGTDTATLTGIAVFGGLAEVPQT